jgi:cytochrome b561
VGRARARYSGLQQVLHWLTALMTAAALPIAWVMTSRPDDRPGTEDLYNLHKTLGLLIFVAIFLRLIARTVQGAPPLPAHVARAERALAEATHALLYAVFLVMTVSGWVQAASSKYPTLLFDVVPLPQLPRDDHVRKAAKLVHDWGQWGVYALLVLHLAGVAVHAAIRRDGLLERMFPAQAAPD